MPLVHLIIVLILVAFCAVSTTVILTKRIKSLDEKFGTLTKQIKSLDEKFGRVSTNLERITLSMEGLNDAQRHHVANSRFLRDELLASMRDLRSRQVAQSEPSSSREPRDDTPERGESKESDSRRWEDSPKPPVSGVEMTGSEPTSNVNDQAVKVGEEILELLDVDGRRSRLSSIGGLIGWIKSTWDDLEAEPLSEREGLWLLAVISRSKKESGVVIPALDTVIGAGVVSDWFDCRLYDGTSPLQRRDVRELAEAIRDAPGQPWRVKKKGFIGRDTGGRGT
jgi:hypothetical protein